MDVTATNYVEESPRTPFTSLDVPIRETHENNEEEWDEWPDPPHEEDTTTSSTSMDVTATNDLTMDDVEESPRTPSTSLTVPKRETHENNYEEPVGEEEECYEPEKEILLEDHLNDPKSENEPSVIPLLLDSSSRKNKSTCFQDCFVMLHKLSMFYKIFSQDCYEDPEFSRILKAETQECFHHEADAFYSARLKRYKEDNGNFFCHPVEMLPMFCQLGPPEGSDNNKSGSSTSLTGQYGPTFFQAFHEYKYQSLDDLAAESFDFPPYGKKPFLAAITYHEKHFSLLEAVSPEFYLAYSNHLPYLKRIPKEDFWKYGTKIAVMFYY